MGQRLNIEIKENDKVLANAYYHWSGYTSSALDLTSSIINDVDSVIRRNRVINAVKLLELTGAGLTDKEKEYLREYMGDYNKYTFKRCIGRNEGLIAVSPEGMEETEYWEEARVTINLTSRIIDFKAVRIYSKEEYKQIYENKCNYPVYDIDFSNIPFKEFKEINKFILGLISKKIHGIIDKEGDVVDFIE